MKNKKKKVLIGGGIVLLLFLASLIGGGLYMLDFSLRPENRGKDMEGSMAYMRQTYPHIVPWIDSLKQCRALRDTFITAPDGIRMHAFYVRHLNLRHIQPLSYMVIPTMLSVCSISGIFTTVL